MRLNARHTFSGDKGESKREWGECKSKATVYVETVEKVMVGMELSSTRVCSSTEHKSKYVRCELIWKKCTYLLLFALLAVLRSTKPSFSMSSICFNEQFVPTSKRCAWFSTSFYSVLRLFKRKTNIEKHSLAQIVILFGLFAVSLYLTNQLLNERIRLEIIAQMFVRA